MRRHWSVVLATLLLAVGSAWAATTSRMVGTITDNDGAALPGVTVTVSSERLLGGPQVVVTDDRGGFALYLLPVGVYTVAGSLDGFAPVTVEVRVALDRTASVEVAMVPVRFEGSVEVTAKVPVVDTRQVGTQVVMDQAFLEGAAVGMDGRDFLSLMTTLPGVAGTTAPSVYGSTSSDNRYLLDGLSITDPAFGGLWRLPVNRDVIDELAVHTGGFEAEYGQGVGAIVNVVTRSGGNDFTCTLDARYRDGRFIEEGGHFDRDEQTSSRRALSGTLGGPVLRDRLWFFAAVDSTVDRHQDEGAPVPYDDETWSWFGKLSWQVASSRLVLKGSSSGQMIDGFNSSRLITASASATQQWDYDVWQLESSSVLSDAALLEAQAGTFRSPGGEYPTSASRDTVGHYNLDTEVLSEAEVWVGREDMARDELRLAMSLFAEGAGDHELKLGVDYQRLGYELQDARPGGMQALDRIPPPGFVDVNGDGFYTEQVYEMTMDDWGSAGDLWSGFVQDAWRPLPRLTVKPGLRYDRMVVDNSVSGRAADMPLWQPRLGLAWDVAGDARHVLRASWGRFMDSTGLSMVRAMHGGFYRSERYYRTQEYYCNHVGVCDLATLERVLGPSETRTAADGTVWVLWPNESASVDGLGYTTVDQMGVGRTRAPYADQLTLAYEVQPLAGTAIELTVVDKKTSDILEETCINNSWVWDSSVPEPSLDDLGTWTSASDCSWWVITNLPDLYRSYRAAIARLETRQERYHLLTSYTYSRSRGNYPYGLERYYISEFWDLYPVGFVNQDGWLDDDRRHRVKLNGYLLLPWDLKLSLSGYWSSAGHVTARATCSALAGASTEALAFYGVDASLKDYCYDSEGQLADVWPILLEPRGSTETNSEWQVDLQLAKSIDIKSTTLKLILAVYNLFDQELAKAYNETAFRQMTDDDGDPLTDAEGNPVWMPVGYPTSFYQPRRYEVGVRVEF